MQNKAQKTSQASNQNESSAPKPQQKIFNAFANILMKYQANKSQNDDVTPSKSDKKQHQAPVFASDKGNTNTQHVQNQNESDMYIKNRKLTLASDNEGQVAQQQELEQNQKPKRLIKKAGKKSNPQEDNIPKNSYEGLPPQFFSKKSQKVTETVQIIQSDEQQQPDNQQEEVMEIQKAGTAAKTNNSKAIQLPDLLRITPQIYICQDKSIKRLLNIQNENYTTQTANNQMSKVNFTIDIVLLSNKELAISSNTNKTISNFMTSKNSNLLSNSFVREPNKSNEKGRSKQLIEEFSFEPPQLQENKRVELEEFYQQTEQSSYYNVKNYNKPQQMTQYNKKTNIQPFKNTLKQNIPQPSKKNDVFDSKKSQMPQSTIKFELEKQRQSKNYFDAFKTRNEPMNTSCVTLQDLVKQLFKRNLINELLYNQFIENHSMQDIKDFLIKFGTGKLHHFDYNKIKFTLLDHRRIAELLVNLFSDHYFIGNCNQQDPDVLQFLTSLYQLEAEDYFNLYTKIDKISGIKWWGKILLANDQRLMEVNKERRIARRRAEQASLAAKQADNAKKESESNKSMSQIGETEKIKPPQRTFFGHSQQTKANIKRKRQQQKELMQIRDLVTNKFTGKAQKSQENNNKLIMRKKIKFY